VRALTMAKFMRSFVVSAALTAAISLLLIETQTDLREMEQALAAARDAAPGLAVGCHRSTSR